MSFAELQVSGRIGPIVVEPRAKPQPQTLVLIAKPITKSPWIVRPPQATAARKSPMFAPAPSSAKASAIPNIPDFLTASAPAAANDQSSSTGGSSGGGGSGGSDDEIKVFPDDAPEIPAFPDPTPVPGEKPADFYGPTATVKLPTPPAAPKPKPAPKKKPGLSTHAKIGIAFALVAGTLFVLS